MSRKEVIVAYIALVVMLIVLAGMIAECARAAEMASPLPQATQGQPYKLQLSARYGTAPYTWAVKGSLPDGLALDGAKGKISGVPTKAGLWSFTVTVTDSAGSATGGYFSLGVSPPMPAVSLAGITTITQGECTILSWFSDNASSLVMDQGVGDLAVPSGQKSVCPTATTTYTVTATGAEDVVKSSITITVNPKLAISTPSLPDGKYGTPYSSTLAATGGWPPYRWAISEGALPPGLTLDETGVISGKPQTLGTFNFTAECRDATFHQAGQSYGTGIHGVTLTWTKDSAVAYNLYRSVTSGSGFARVNVTPIAAPPYIDGDVQSGARYFYVATGLYSGNFETGYSNEASAQLPTW